MVPGIGQGWRGLLGHRLTIAAAVWTVREVAGAGRALRERETPRGNGQRTRSAETPTSPLSAAVVTIEALVKVEGV